MEDEPLSIDDARILGLEDAAIAGHTLKLLLLERGPPLDLDALRARVDSRLPEDSRGRRRIELEPQPCWAPDPGFDVADHIGRIADSEGVNERGMWAVAARLMSERLDHNRPLWRFDLVGPLSDGRDAIVCRIHHAMADGISSVRFLHEVLWDEADAPERPARARSRPAAEEAQPHVSEVRRMSGTILRELGHRVGDTVLDKPIGSARELAFAAFPLSELKAIGGALPGHVTVNDVFLAGVAGGLRHWLADAGSRIPRLRAQVPVSLHHRDEGEAELGNRDSFLNVELPVAEADPIARLESISAQTSERKEHGDAEELYDLFHALSRFPHLEHAAQKLASSPKEFSLSISNVPGPGGRLSVDGRAVEHLFSVAEPAHGHALRASAISCSGMVGIGLCTDPDAVAGVAELAAAIEASLADLRTATLG